MYTSLDIDGVWHIDKDGINSVTSPFTHAHLFSAGYVKNDKESFFACGINPQYTS